MTDTKIIEAVARAIANDADQEDYMEDYLRYDNRARAAIAAHVAALDAAGWQIVPREPTEGMIDAGENAPQDYWKCDPATTNGREVWHAMLAAAPKIE